MFQAKIEFSKILPKYVRVCQGYADHAKGMSRQSVGMFMVCRGAISEGEPGW